MQAAVVLLAASLSGRVRFDAELPSLRERAATEAAWIEKRVHEVLPPLMKQYEVDVWVLSQREYGEDTLWRHLAEPTRVNARRRTVMVYGLTEDKTDVEASTFVGFNTWMEVREKIASYKPERILVDINTTFAFADGLRAGEEADLKQGLGEKLWKHVVHDTAELAIYWTAIRVDGMLEIYQKMMTIVHNIIGTAFSSDVIVPGVTSTEDVAWFVEDEINSLGLQPGFHPTVGLQRKGLNGTQLNTVIQQGDLLWIDMGLSALNMFTDTQHLGYVLRKGETAPPQSFLDGLVASNKMQDFMLQNIAIGRTGNEVLSRSVEDMQTAGIRGWYYSHPIGDFMHSAGPSFGFVDAPNAPDERSGWLEVKPDTWYSIELCANSSIPEWNDQIVEFRQEEEAFILADGHAGWVLDRQTKFHIVNDTSPRASAERK
ncbi:hypothetical protein DIPPA_29472 [Diplonema papillatum]|nr:hypothetical protein DIPPA_29472 [Diplonema papillatum]